MTEQSPYERVGGVNTIATVVDPFNDEIVSPKLNVSAALAPLGRTGLSTQDESVRASCLLEVPAAIRQSPLQPEGALAKSMGSVDNQTRPTMLAFVPLGLRGTVARAVEQFPLQLAFVSSASKLATRIEGGCPEIVFFDTDLLGCPIDLCRLVRSLRNDAKVIGLSGYWSDRDEALRKCLDAILHKPPRIAEWEMILKRLGFAAVQPAPGRGRAVSRSSTRLPSPVASS